MRNWGSLAAAKLEDELPDAATKSELAEFGVLEPVEGSVPGELQPESVFGGFVSRSTQRAVLLLVSSVRGRGERAGTHLHHFTRFEPYSPSPMPWKITPPRSQALQLRRSEFERPSEGVEELTCWRRRWFAKCRGSRGAIGS